MASRTRRARVVLILVLVAIVIPAALSLSLYVVIRTGERARVSRLPGHLKPEAIAVNYRPQLERLRKVADSIPLVPGPVFPTWTRTQEEVREDDELFDDEIRSAIVQAMESGGGSFSVVSRPEPTEPANNSAWFTREPTLGEASVTEWGDEVIEYREIYVDSRGDARQIEIRLLRARARKRPRE